MNGFFDFPMSIDGRGHAATTGLDDHVRDLIHQVLFTNPGERVNRPDFGCGLKALLFMPNSDALAAATQTLVKSALQKWLELEIRVEDVRVSAADSTLTVSVVYVRRDEGLRRTDTFIQTL
ncbi:MAG TPA: GPW/gp25 family protein [Polyangiaceae bacterium]